MSSEDLPKPGLAIRKATDRALARSAEAVDELVGSDPFSKTLARGMAMSAGTIATARKLTRTVGGLTASWLNLPTRGQVLELSRRIVHLEMLLDDIDARTSEILDVTTNEPDV